LRWVLSNSFLKAQVSRYKKDFYNFSSSGEIQCSIAFKPIEHFDRWGLTRLREDRSGTLSLLIRIRKGL
jgi:hypothetical protein